MILNQLKRIIQPPIYSDAYTPLSPTSAILLHTKLNFFSHVRDEECFRGVARALGPRKTVGRYF